MDEDIRQLERAISIDPTNRELINRLFAARIRGMGLDQLESTAIEKRES
jgi:hypothetical protein